MHRSLTLISTTCLLALATAVPAQADALLHYIDDEGLESQILVRDHMIRMELNEAISGTSGYMLFDARNDQLTVVDDEEQTYLPLTREVMDEQIQAMTDMVSDLRRQMEQLPPDVRDQLKQQLRIGPEGFEAEISTRETDEQREIGEFVCSEIEVLIDDRPQSTVCVADAQSLGLETSDFQTLGALMDRLYELSLRALEAGGPMASQMGASLLPRVEGIPLEVREHDGVTTRLAGLSTDPLSEALFQVPESYEETEMF
ncbi:hypothetical protein TK90_1299 [Thioalkalivibrio sp. K90mix]|jgi:hypothetical protein|uniref:hypothetical protein n=1 Tax=Thioalkalivibrio sp. (strain K90mix) TaxID=396595 RepID=UPI0001C4E1F8|nr:hypothetical protein [Thioalkalivibrio sp. K90mix]ADC71807.1 hypothetical protein TK90_1299 [Thioalkalivibrio sp. K90mix]